MARIFYTVLILTLCKSTLAQEQSIRIEVLQGINKILTGEEFSATRIGYSGAYGISYRYQKKKSAVSFEPQILLTQNSYRLKINEFFGIKIRQRQLSFMPCAGLRISKRTTLKIGLFLNVGDASDVRLIYRNDPSYLSIGKSEYDEHYRPEQLQAGFVLGLAIPLGETKKWCINILVQQFVTSFLNEDYFLDFQGFKPPAKTSFSNEAKATVLFGGLSYRLSKIASGNPREESNNE